MSPHTLQFSPCLANSELSAQVEVGMPTEDLPDQGAIHFAVECSPIASSSFQVRCGHFRLIIRASTLRTVRCMWKNLFR